jgi:hypothetical protein
VEPAAAISSSPCRRANPASSRRYPATPDLCLDAGEVIEAAEGVVKPIDPVKA